MSTRLLGRPAILIPLAGLLFAACSTAATPSPRATATASATPAASPSETASATGSPSGQVYTVNMSSGSVGAYLTGEDGKTLYVKQGDSTTATNCTGDCLTSWPPFTLDAGETVEAGAGVTGTLATFTRPEGETQVTYNGRPLYYFAGDSKAGETNGEGLAGVWSVAAP